LKQQVCTKSFTKELCDGDEDESPLNGEQMAFPSPRRISISQEPLENIVELNYEASSDEEGLLKKEQKLLQ